VKNPVLGTDFTHYRVVSPHPRLGHDDHVPPSKEPMADPAGPTPSDATTDTDLVEFLLVSVPDLSSLRSVSAALADLVASASISILDLVCVSKSEVGELTVAELEQVEEMSALKGVGGNVGGLLSDRDIERASRALAAGSSTLILVVEDRWALGLSTAARQAGGRVVGGGRIGRPLVEAALEANPPPAVSDEQQEDGE